MWQPVSSTWKVGAAARTSPVAHDVLHFPSMASKCIKERHEEPLCFDPQTPYFPALQEPTIQKKLGMSNKMEVPQNGWTTMEDPIRCKMDYFRVSPFENPTNEPWMNQPWINPQYPLSLGNNLIQFATQLLAPFEILCSKVGTRFQQQCRCLQQWKLQGSKELQRFLLWTENRCYSQGTIQKIETWNRNSDELSRIQLIDHFLVDRSLFCGSCYASSSRKTNHMCGVNHAKFSRISFLMTHHDKSSHADATTAPGQLVARRPSHEAPNWYWPNLQSCQSCSGSATLWSTSWHLWKILEN